MKRQIGSDAFSAQYLQQPMPPGGATIKRHWIMRYKELPPKSEWRYVLQSWDTASKGGPDNDWSVCTTWVVTKNPMRWYLAHVWRQRVDYPTLKSNVLRLAKEHGAQRVLVEDTSAGTALIQDLRGRVFGITAVKPEGEKLMRMSHASSTIERGEVYLPEQAPWLPDLEAELFSFPGSRHDDQCNSISQALIYGTKKPPMYISPEAFKRLMS